ncbi:phiSA1p31-related protein [Streptomyces sp. NPDC099050]|uniref:phiSA1p31-related protein n=1 Tax=Streptomyces sp. NPDC099050 TaxID=3366100 RepID=UPI003828BF88
MSTSLTADYLRRMLAQVAPHVGSEDTLPAINAVHIEARHGWLYAVATDRFTMGIARKSVVDEGSWKTAIRGSDLPTVEAWLKRATGYVVTLTPGTAGDDLALTLSTGTNVLAIAASSGIGALPDWRKILRKYLEEELQPVPLTGLTSRYLARWKDADEILHVWQSAPKAPFVLMGDNEDFAGLQMPVDNGHLTRDKLIDIWQSSLRQIAFVEGLPYDLGSEWTDFEGDPWKYTGRDRDGEPLMRLGDIDEDYTLAEVIAEFGPISILPS